jgi:hypothetical protein
MGIIADLFISTPEAAIQYQSTLEKPALHQQYESIEFKGLTGLEFGILWAILEKEEWDIDKHSLTEIQFGEDGETWLMLFPERLVNQLRSIDSSSFEAILLQWSNAEEFQLNGITSEDIRPIFESLIKLATKSSSLLKNP